MFFFNDAAWREALGGIDPRSAADSLARGLPHARP